MRGVEKLWLSIVCPRHGVFRARYHSGMISTLAAPLDSKKVREWGRERAGAGGGGGGGRRREILFECAQRAKSRVPESRAN